MINSSLTFSLLGNVVLDELQLKKEALDKLNLPVEIFYGMKDN